MIGILWPGTAPSRQGGYQGCAWAHGDLIRRAGNGIPKKNAPAP